MLLVISNLLSFFLSNLIFGINSQQFAKNRLKSYNSTSNSSIFQIEFFGSICMSHHVCLVTVTVTPCGKVHAEVHFFVGIGLFCCVFPIIKYVCLKVEFLLKTDSGYPKDTGVNKPW